VFTLPVGGIRIAVTNPTTSPGHAVDRLTQHIAEAQQRGWDYARWAAATGTDHWIDGDYTDPVLQDRRHLVHAREHVRRARLAVANDAAAAAREAIASRRFQHRDNPEGRLQLGLSLAASEDFSEALAALRTARNLYEDPSVFEAESGEIPMTPELRRQSRYHYGLRQYLSGEDLPAAVGALRSALVDQTDDARVVLHLARAITDLVNGELLVEASNLYDKYFRLGAPFGITTDDRAFMTPHRASGEADWTTIPASRH
jgi:hypothetical protein